MTPPEHLQLETLHKDLRDQFQPMESAWNLREESTDGSVFNEVEGMITTAKEAVDKVLLDSDMFLETKKVFGKTNTEVFSMMAGPNPL